MFVRIIKYLKKMYLWYIPTGLLFFLSIYFLGEAIISNDTLTLNIDVVRGIFTILIMLLIFRIMDDINDYDIDIVKKKDRPTAKRIVKLKDLKTTMIIATIISIVINVFQYWLSLIIFIITISYCYLMYFYFFKESMKKSIPLIFFALLLIIYIYSHLVKSYGDKVFNLDLILVIVMIYLPYTAWELARKVKYNGTDINKMKHKYIPILLTYSNA